MKTQNTLGCFEVGENRIQYSAQNGYSETKKLHQSWCRGYTFVELVIVLSIIALMMAVVIPSFSAFRQSSSLNGDAMNLITLANRAKLLSVSDKSDMQYGIHLESGKAVLFQGSTYSPSATTNETHTFSNGITLSSIDIQGGGSEILFEKVTGAANHNATTTLTVSGSSASTTILVYLTGIVTIQ